jgi:hypothetical protein
MPTKPARRPAPGRPPLSPEGRRSVPVSSRLTPREGDRLRRAMSALAESQHALVRRAILELLDRERIA